MKLTMYNGDVHITQFSVIAGGYNNTAGKVVLMVRETDRVAGTLEIDVNEGHALAEILGRGLPKVTTVVPMVIGNDQKT